MNDLYQELYSIADDLEQYQPEPSSSLRDSVKFASTGSEALMAAKWHLQQIDIDRLESENLKKRISLAISRISKALGA
jgi:hypothetical protein